MPIPECKKIVNFVAPESQDVFDYFAGKKAKDIEVDDDEIAWIDPLLWLSKLGVQYYLQSFLGYCVDYSKISAGLDDRIVDGIIRHLCSKDARRKNPNYTTDQLSVIVEVLRFIRCNKGSFFLDEEEELEMLDNGLIMWESELRKPK